MRRAVYLHARPHESVTHRTQWFFAFVVGRTSPALQRHFVGRCTCFLGRAAGGGGLFESRLPCLEITAFSLIVDGVLLLVGLGLANLCYFLGPISERVFRPSNAAAFRRRSFALGTGFSLVLIFLPVVGIVIAAAFGPTGVANCG